MMRKVLPLTALILCLASGAALADRDRHDRERGRGRHDNRGHVVREHRGDWNRGDWNRGNWNRDRGDRYRDRVIIRNEPRHNYRHYDRHNSYRHVVRRPIYVSRPIIRHRYYNYYQRPALVVENYNAMPGYYWVRGTWRWDGYEWIWEPGHYEPDPNYVDPNYGYDYDYNYNY